MIPISETPGKFKKQFLRTEYIFDFVLAVLVIMLFTLLVYLSVTILSTP
jgi:hypothetical protein